MFIAKDLNQFKYLFVSKLKDMLSDDGLGAFILVLANSRQDAFLREELAVELQKTFFRLKDNFIAGKLDAPQDDIDVFKQIIDIELDEIETWQYRRVGDWEVTYNSMRRLRPARASSQVLNSITQDFDENRFHFNKPFLKPEILWEGEHRGVMSRVLYNKFPFSDYHLLIVISPQENRSQLLTPQAHDYVFALVQEMNDFIPGFGIGFNSLAAGASVNHFHFQGFMREQAFPIEHAQWHHNGGKADYPLAVNRFADAAESWRYIEHLIRHNKAFNCVYRNSCCYVIERKFQGTVELPEWLTGAGWLDVAGVCTVSDEATFQQLTADEWCGGLRLLAAAEATAAISI